MIEQRFCATTYNDSWIEHSYIDKEAMFIILFFNSEVNRQKHLLRKMLTNNSPSNFALSWYRFKFISHLNDVSLPRAEVSINNINVFLWTARAARSRSRNTRCGKSALFSEKKSQKFRASRANRNTHCRDATSHKIVCATTLCSFSLSLPLSFPSLFFLFSFFLY